MVHINKFVPVIILVLLAAALGLGGDYLQRYADKIPFVVVHRVHLAMAFAVAALIYAFSIVPKKRESQGGLPSYDEVT